MRQLELFGYRVEIDEEATRAWYAHAEDWNCSCGVCRNFLQLARARKLPAFVLELLDELSIPPEKATNVCFAEETEDRLVCDVAWRIAGQILSAPNPEAFINKPDMGGCGYDFSPHSAPNFPTPFFDLMFCLGLPWVLDEPFE